MTDDTTMEPIKDNMPAAVETDRKTLREQADEWLEVAQALDGLANSFGLQKDERQGIDGIIEVIEEAAESVKNGEEPPEDRPHFFEARAYKALGKGLMKLANTQPLVVFLLTTLQDITELEPFLAEELKKPEYQGKTLEQLATEADRLEREGKPSDGTLYAKAVAAARAARAAAEGREEQEQPLQLPQVLYNKKPDISLTIGKGSVVLFSPREWLNYWKEVKTQERGQIPGQMSFFPVKYERDGNEEITLYCGVSENSFRRSMSSEDYFYLSFIGDFYLAGNRVVSISKFFREITGKRGNTTQLTELYNKLAELQATPLVIRDREVREAWSVPPDKNDPKATYKEIRQPAAPITLGAERFIANGGIAEAKIRIYDFPAILKVDLDIGQYTTVQKTLLQVKEKNGRAVNRTPRFYTVLQYLINRIARIKSGKQKNKILYDTFFNDIGETTTRGQQLALDLFFKILDHFVREGWITSYKEETTKSTGKTGVKFTWSSTPASSTRKGKNPR